MYVWTVTLRIRVNEAAIRETTHTVVAHDYVDAAALSLIGSDVDNPPTVTKVERGPLVTAIWRDADDDEEELG